MAYVFVSYARKDKSRVAPLAEALEAEGWSVWWDIQIPLGRSFDEVIEEALDAAGCVIVVWTNRSIGSRYVKNETRAGLERNILAPVLLEDVKLPLEFRDIQAADLAGWKPGRPSAGYEQLVARIRELVPLQAAGPAVGTPFATQETISPVFSRPSSTRSPGLVVDPGAFDAMRRGRNLLPIGVNGVVGSFAAGSRVSLYDMSNRVAAFGRVTYGSEEIKQIAGHHSGDIASSLGRYSGDEVVSHSTLEWVSKPTPSFGIVVDGVALDAVRRGANLLPVGVASVKGDFGSGDRVRLYDTSGRVVGTASSVYSAQELRRIMGRHSREIAGVAEYRGDASVEHQTIEWL